MKVFKFGGASINTAERIQNAGRILASYKGEKILVIISAMGKTTNALEKVVDAFYEGRKDDALQLFEQVKQSHLTLLKYLVAIQWKAAEDQLRISLQKWNGCCTINRYGNMIITTIRWFAAANCSVLPW